ncbi:succinate--CoA ligase subunit alpha [bacterium]|nr:succinate--CoA ligase subunit alpha [bacterium]
MSRNEGTRVIVKGMTGREGAFHPQAMMDYGTNVVGGVTPGKGGTTHLDHPVFPHCLAAVEETGATASVAFVPPRFVLGAVEDAVESGIKLLVVITEGVPLLDEILMGQMVKEAGATMIGPNCPGILSSGIGKMGIMPSGMFRQGNVGLVSRSGTLTYEVVDLICRAGMGISTAVGIGGDRVIGARFKDVLLAFEADEETDGVVMVGEIGGDDEERAAALIPTLGKLKDRVVGFIGGRTAPEGKAMGHAGAIVEGNKGTPLAKVAALEAVGVPVPERLSEIPALLQPRLPR